MFDFLFFFHDGDCNINNYGSINLNSNGIVGVSQKDFTFRCFLINLKNNATPHRYLYSLATSGADNTKYDQLAGYKNSVFSSNRLNTKLC